MSKYLKLPSGSSHKSHREKSKWERNGQNAEKIVYKKKISRNYDAVTSAHTNYENIYENLDLIILHNP